ncbi:DUF1697 domain-containing protein [Flavobacterium sp. U410]
MTTYISILRGINVSGKNIIKMDALKTLYQSLEFDNITTYIQSGNVIFTSSLSDTTLLEQKISEQIKSNYGYEIPVIVMKFEQLKQIIENNPFLEDNSNNPEWMHITFLSATPIMTTSSAIEEKIQNEEKLSIAKNAVYLYCPKGYGQTKLTNTFLESKLKVKTTTRNWKTTNELLRLVKELDNSI